METSGIADAIGDSKLADRKATEVSQIKIPQHGARSMSLADAMHPHNVLCDEMKGAARPQPHGFPLRLIAPGWYGIADVEWLKRIEIRGTRFMGRVMARDYVTILEETQNGDTVWTATSVGWALLTSVPAKGTRKDGQYRIIGAAWGASMARVEVQSDGGPWMAAPMARHEEAAFAWKLWSLEWVNATPGEPTITVCTSDTQRQVQPAKEDPRIAKKHMYWESNGHVTRRLRRA